MPIHTTSIPCLSVPPLHLLIDKIFKVLLPNQSFLKLGFVSHDMLFRFIVEAHHKFETFVNFRVFEKFDSPDVVGIEHIFVHSWNLVGAVLALNTFCEDLDMPSDLSDEGVPGALEDQTYGEVRIVFLLLKTCICQASFECEITPLFVC